MATASARFAAPTFSSIWLTCSSTLRAESPSCLAMSLLVRPRTRDCRTSVCRPVSPRIGGSAFIWFLISALTEVLPAATSRMAETSSSFSALFRMAPAAPAARAWAIPSDVAKLVRMRTRTPGVSCNRRRVAVVPSIFGIMRSMTTTSGLSRRDSATACSPLRACPTTSRSAFALKSAARPMRTTAWSSTISIRIFFMPDEWSLGWR